jgi:hypothetical protein
VPHWAARRSAVCISSSLGARRLTIVYRLGSDLRHVSVVGLIGHELKWEAEALRVGHGALLQTLVSLYNAYHKAGTEFRDRIEELAKEFDPVWAKIRAAKK